MAGNRGRRPAAGPAAPEGDTGRAPRPRRPWWQRGVLGVGVLVLLVALAGIGAVGYGMWRLGQIERFDVVLPDAAPGEPENYLIVGSDSRAEVAADDPNRDVMVGAGAEGQRSDTVMIARVDAVAGTVAVLSIPRDLTVKLAGTERVDRINAAYAVSRQELIDTITLNFSLPIHHYVEIDFNAFQRIVDQVGGVPLWFDTPVRDINSGLSVPTSGCVVLTGEQALAFARSRRLEHWDGRRWRTDPTGDLGRITRQQVFLRRVADKAGKANLTDPRRAKGLLDATVDHVGLDARSSVDELVALLRHFKGVSGDDLETHSLPTYPYTLPGGAEVLGLWEIDAQPVLNRFRGLPDDWLLPSLVKVNVINRTASNGWGALAADAFRADGFTVLAHREEVQRKPPARTEVKYGPGGERSARLLERYLSAGGAVVADNGLPRDTVTVVMGADFTTIRRDPRPDAVAAASASGSTVPGSTVPGSTVPGSTVPGSTVAPSTSARPTTIATTVAPRSSAVPTTTEAVIGRAVGEPPEGVDC